MVPRCNFPFFSPHFNYLRFLEMHDYFSLLLLCYFTYLISPSCTRLCEMICILYIESTVQPSFDLSQCLCLSCSYPAQNVSLVHTVDTRLLHAAYPRIY